jgi:hypothetical protein
MAGALEVKADAFTTNVFGDVISSDLYFAALLCFGGGYLSRVETDITGKIAKWFVKMPIEDARIYQEEFNAEDSHLIGIKKFVEAIVLCVTKKSAAKAQGGVWSGAQNGLKNLRTRK